MPASFRFIGCVLLALGLVSGPQGRAQQAATTTPAPAPAMATSQANNSTLRSPDEGAKRLIAQALQQMNGNDVNGALSSLTQALKLNPNATGAYVLRASLYCQKKQWTQAEDDFRSAQKLAPTNVVLQFNLVEVKFMQKQYDLARTGFLALEKDPDMGDFASYKVFLCDLFGGHEDQAKKELDVFNDAMGNPSYYFSNAAWDLVHRDLEGARQWLLSASRIYPLQKNTYYAQSLHDLGYLPIPGPNDVVTPPPATNSPTAQ